MTKAKSNKFQVYRYLRPFAFFETSSGGEITLSDDNLGGLTFFIEVNHELGSLSWAESICNDTDNFDHYTARKIAQDRYNANQITTVKYDASETLIDNILTYYSEMSNQKSITARERTVFERIKQYISVNNALIDMAEEAIVNGAQRL